MLRKIFVVFEILKVKDLRCFDTLLKYDLNYGVTSSRLLRRKVPVLQAVSKY